MPAQGPLLQLGSSAGIGERRGEGPTLEGDDLTVYRKLARRENPFRTLAQTMQ